MSGSRGLAARITILFILIAIVSASMSVISTLVIAKQQFASYVNKSNQEAALQWSALLVSYYSEHGSLDGAQQLLNNRPNFLFFSDRGIFGIKLNNPPEPAPMEDDGNMPRRMKGGRDIVVANTRGRIVAASNETMLGKQVDEDIKKSSAYPLETGDGNRIGTLYISSPLNMGISSLENTFVHNVTMQAIWTAAVVVFIALLLGLFLARRITSPLEELSSAIHKLAQGQLTARVKPRGDREFVSLGRDFNLMASKLMDQEIARRRLMSDIAHELRTPLTLLRGQLEAMQSGRLEFSEDIISSLVDETIRLTRLVKDLEAISLAESGNLPMTITEVNIKEVVEKLAPVRLAMEEQQINMAVLVDESIESIKVDLNRLLQILINLLSNAMRYSKAGDEIKLEINADKTGIIFSVSDMGPGIAPEHLPHLFDRFYRADESRSSISGGRGLGLSIARSYAEAHGGRIWVESELGAGTTFYVFIPQ